ncbi:MAG: site-specific integrase [Sedimentisphaerales bacterium]|nr:site-specific integrase [Sedimentisphaerales bacterium]
MRRAVTLYKDRKQGKNGIVEYWCCRWFDENGKRRSKALGRVDELSERDAKKRTSEIELAFDKNPSKRNTGKALTTSQLCQDYLEEKGLELRPGTVLKRKECQTYLLKHFGQNRRIDSISKVDAGKFKTALLSNRLRVEKKRKEKLAKNTVNSILVMAKAIFNWAVEKDLLTVNPFAHVVMDTEAPKEWHPVELDEFNKIMEHAPQRLKLVIALCRMCGLRSGEALNLRWSNIDWDKNRLTIIACDEWMPKDGDKRVIPIPPELAKMLLAAYAAAPEGQEKVITDVYEGNLHRDFLAILKRAGLKPFDKPIHSLRKSCITDWASRYPMHVVKEYAGHASITTTQTFYTQVSDSDYDKATKESFWTKPVVTEKVTESQEKPKNEAVDTNKKAS